jgi:archaemetzincin
VSVIAIAAAGTVDAECLDYVQACLTVAMSMETRRMQPLPEPAYAYDVVRGQYSSTLILHEALTRRPANASRLFVLTERDLFIPMLSFVYGQAQLGGGVAILSTARLRQEFYGLPGNRPLLMLRLRKETLHEMGHTMGLTHCNDQRCTMALSTNIQQLDAKRGEYCESCAVLLRESVAALSRDRS